MICPKFNFRKCKKKVEEILESNFTHVIHENVVIITGFHYFSKDFFGDKKCEITEIEI